MFSVGPPPASSQRREALERVSWRGVCRAVQFPLSNGPKPWSPGERPRGGVSERATRGARIQKVIVSADHFGPTKDCSAGFKTNQGREEGGGSEPNPVWAANRAVE